VSIKFRTIKSAAGQARVVIRPPIEHMQQFWLRGKFFEQEELESIYWRYRGGIFVDVGSSIGNHTLFFAKFCQVERVISIEPVLYSVGHQIENLRLNNLYNVSVLNVAAGSSHGACSMERFGPNLGQFCVASGNNVSTMPLDSLLKGIEQITLMKIDVEKHELKVLEGAGRTLDKHKPILYLELLGRKIYTDVTDFLKRFGYMERESWVNNYRFEAQR